MILQSAAARPAACFDRSARRAKPEKLSRRARHDIALRPEIAHIFADDLAVDSVREGWLQLNRESFIGVRCGVKRLVGMMGRNHLTCGRPIIHKIFVDKAAPSPPDHVNG